MRNLLYIFLVVSTLVNAEDQNVIRKYLEGKFHDVRKIEFEIISPNQNQLGDWEIDNLREFKVGSGYAYMPIKLLKNGKSKNSVLTLKLNLYKSVLVANREIRKKEHLSINDFTVKIMDISSYRFEPMTISAPVNSYRSKLNIPEKSILMGQMVELIPDVQTGDKIDALYSNNSVNITFPVTARTEGITGDKIRVKNDDNQIFEARILNNSTE